MAETLLASFATSAGTGAAAASAGAAIGPVTAAASGLGSLSLVGSLGSTALTGLSIAGALNAGGQQAGLYKIQQRQSEISARTERLRGAQQVSNIREKLRSTIASQNALFAGRGISLADGSPVSVAGESMRQAGRDIQIAQYGTDAQVGAIQSQGQQYAAEAEASQSGGLMDAFAIGMRNSNSLRRGARAITSLVG